MAEPPHQHQNGLFNIWDKVFLPGTFQLSSSELAWMEDNAAKYTVPISAAFPIFSDMLYERMCSRFKHLSGIPPDVSDNPAAQSALFNFRVNALKHIDEIIYMAEQREESAKRDSNKPNYPIENQRYADTRSKRKQALTPQKYDEDNSKRFRANLDTRTNVGIKVTDILPTSNQQQKRGYDGGSDSHPKSWGKREPYAYTPASGYPVVTSTGNSPPPPPPPPSPPPSSDILGPTLHPNRNKHRRDYKNNSFEAKHMQHESRASNPNDPNASTTRRDISNSGRQTYNMGRSNDRPIGMRNQNSDNGANRGILDSNFDATMAKGNVERQSIRKDTRTPENNNRYQHYKDDRQPSTRDHTPSMPQRNKDMYASGDRDSRDRAGSYHSDQDKDNELGPTIENRPSQRNELSNREELTEESRSQLSLVQKDDGNISRRRLDKEPSSDVTGKIMQKEEGIDMEKGKDNVRRKMEKVDDQDVDKIKEQEDGHVTVIEQEKETEKEKVKQRKGEQETGKTEVRQSEKVKENDRAQEKNDIIQEEKAEHRKKKKAIAKERKGKVEKEEIKDEEAQVIEGGKEMSIGITEEKEKNSMKEDVRVVHVDKGIIEEKENLKPINSEKGREKEGVAEHVNTRDYGHEKESRLEEQGRETERDINERNSTDSRTSDRNLKDRIGWRGSAEPRNSRVDSDLRQSISSSQKVLSPTVNENENSSLKSPAVATEQHERTGWESRDKDDYRSRDTRNMNAGDGYYYGNQLQSNTNYRDTRNYGRVGVANPIHNHNHDSFGDRDRVKREAWGDMRDRNKNMNTHVNTGARDTRHLASRYDAQQRDRWAKGRMGRGEERPSRMNENYRRQDWDTNNRNSSANEYSQSNSQDQWQNQRGGYNQNNQREITDKRMRISGSDMGHTDENDARRRQVRSRSAREASSHSTGQEEQEPRIILRVSSDNEFDTLDEGSTTAKQSGDNGLNDGMDGMDEDMLGYSPASWGVSD